MRKKKTENSVDEGWLLPYSDMLTLLLALFIVMFAIAKTDDNKLNELSDQFNVIFSTKPNNKSGNGGILPDYPKEEKKSDKVEQKNKEVKIKMDEEKILSAGNDIKKNLVDAGHGDDIDITQEDDGLRISIKSGLLFSPGSAEISNSINQLIAKISDSLKSLDNDIIIAGYTDNIPNKTITYNSNWELSAARAISVMEVLVKNHAVKEEQISIQAYGEFKPKVPNNNEENRSKNRRVEIFILKN